MPRRPIRSAGMRGVFAILPIVSGGSIASSWRTGCGCGPASRAHRRAPPAGLRRPPPSGCVPATTTSVASLARSRPASSGWTPRPASSRSVASYLAATDGEVDEPSLSATDAHDTGSLRIIQAQEGGAAAPGRGGPRRTGAGADQRHLPGRVPGPGHRRHAPNGACRAGLPSQHAARRPGRGPRIHHRAAAAGRRRGPGPGPGRDRRAVRSSDGIAVDVSVNGIDGRLTPDEQGIGPAHHAGGPPERPQALGGHRGADRYRESGQLVIGDNGRGFDVMRLASAASRNFGLHFMRERAELMGASVRSSRDRGRGPASCCASRSRVKTLTSYRRVRQRQARRPKIKDAARATDERPQRAADRRAAGEDPGRDRRRPHPVPSRRSQHPRAGERHRGGRRGRQRSRGDRRGPGADARRGPDGPVTPGARTASRRPSASSASCRTPA